MLQNNKTFDLIIKTIATIATLAMVVVAIVLYGADVSALLIFLVFAVFYIQLPGLCILDLLHLKTNHFSTRLLFAFFAGWALDVLLYFIVDVISGDIGLILLYAICPLLSIIFILNSYSNRKNNSMPSFHFSKLSACIFVFVALSLLLTLLNTQYQYPSPELSKFIYMNPDKAYHLGLIDSLSHGYPLESPWIQGRIIKYHIFTEVLYSIPIKLFKLSSDVILITCGPYMTVYAVCLSIYCLFNEFCTKKERAGLYSLLLFLSNIFIGKAFFSSVAYKFIFVNENAAGYGVAGAITCLILFKYWYDSLISSREDSSHHWPWFILLLALIMLETGIKGPMGAVVIAGICGTLILGLIMRKVSFKAVLPTFLLVVGFFTVYATILGLKGQSNGSGAAVFKFGTITSISFWKSSLIDALTSLGIPGPGRLLIILLIFFLCMTTAYCLPFCIGYVRELILVLSGKKDFDFARINIYASTLVGIIAMFFLNYSGCSQIYFGLVSVFLVPLIAYWLFEDLESSDNAFCTKIYRILKVIFIVSLIITTSLLMFYYVHKIRVANIYLDINKHSSRYLSISNDEYDAMKWIEDNTPEDALLATDRYYSVSPRRYSYQNRWSNRFFLYAAYSNRFYYISGSGYNLGANEWTIRQQMIETNAELFDVNNQHRGDKARELGIDYIVLSKRFSGNIDLSNEDYLKCYCNKDIDIYEVN